MTTQHDSRISWVALILCVCLGSLVISPPLLMIGTSGPNIYMIDLENSSGFDESEFDDDFSAPPVAYPSIACFVFSRFSSVSLNFQSPFLSPVSPPPK